ncbi:MAG: hypothetical protein IKS65_03900 [Bacteroidales bacterium]|nr:hypothetical protein [Bacteroidales bacterium]
MKSRLLNIDINPQSPFEEDLLHRAQYANILTNVLRLYNDGAVIAINGEWGSGKTTFIRKWQQLLENQKFTTIYFNAWESDYIDDPMVPLIANLKTHERIDENSTKQFEKIVKVGSRLAVATAIGLGKGLIGSLGSDILKSGIDALANETNDIFKKQIESFSSQTKSMDDFKRELRDYVSKICDDKPLIYFVDELDRCCPTYAVRVLERIKHLFEIEGIVFVLSIDKIQLSNSIKGYYGSDINTEEYLRRFIDIIYNLPQPDVKEFCEYLYDYYDFRPFFQNPQRRSSMSYYSAEETSFLEAAEFITIHEHLTLRQLDRIFSLTRLSLKSFDYNHYLFPDLFFFLSFIKICHSNLFDLISQKALLIQDLVNEIEKLIEPSMIKTDSDGDAKDIVFTIARLLVVYAQDMNKTDKGLIVKNPNKQLTFKTYKIPSNKLLEYIEFCDNRARGGNCPLYHFTNKISLIDRFVN